jgi:hypothetical protein
MKTLFAALLLTLFSPSAFALTCDSADRLGNHGSLSIDLPAKKILLNIHGNTQPLFDANTLCGWRPSKGTAGISCPFTQQKDLNSFLNVDLTCDQSTETAPIALTSGSLQLQGGSGSLDCWIFSQEGAYLHLSNCR